MNRRQILGLLLSLAAPATRAIEEKTGTWVAAMRRGEIFSIDAIMVAPVTPREAWDVLVDFDAWASFVPNMMSSRIVARQDNVIRVEQRGELKWGPVTEPYATVREVQLTPLESIRSTTVAGATPREQSLTRFKEVPAGTEIWHRAEMVFDTWMPDRVAETVLQKIMQERYEAFVAEMVRRKSASR
jgi:ribosome-associated toxin RatA of RatAB toxin-antitoxin module